MNLSKNSERIICNFKVIILFIFMSVFTIRIFANTPQQCRVLFEEVNKIEDVQSSKSNSEKINNDANELINDKLKLIDDIQSVLSIAKVMKDLSEKVQRRMRLAGLTEKSVDQFRVNLIMNLYRYLENAQANSAVSLLRSIFEKVQFSYYEIKVSKLKQEAGQQLSAEEHAQLIKYKTDFANNFKDFIDTLEVLISSSQKKNIVDNKTDENGYQNIRSQTSIDVMNLLSIKEIIGETKVREIGGEPKLKDYIDLYKSDPEYQILRLKHEANDQLLKLFITRISNFINSDTIQKQLMKIPVISENYKHAFSFLVGISYVNHVISAYRPYIYSIVNMTNRYSLSPENLYSVFKEISVQSGNQAQFLRTFVRIPMYHDIWMKVKNHVDILVREREKDLKEKNSKINSDNEADAIFLKLMLEADAFHQKKGPLDIYHNPSILDYVPQLVVFAIYAIAYSLINEDASLGMAVNNYINDIIEERNLSQAKDVTFMLESGKIVKTSDPSLIANILSTEPEQMNTLVYSGIQNMALVSEVLKNMTGLDPKDMFDGLPSLESGLL